ncbi:MAG: coxO, partial [Myxococcales bacterium]|nr:coxO [Myxococcales bacterium]
RAGRPTRGRAFGALALGVGFLLAQVFVWRGLVLAGGGPASGIYGSVFFAISGLHALHVLGGVVALAAVARGPLTARRLGLCAFYWDFVLVVWVLFFVGACLE